MSDKLISPTVLIYSLKAYKLKCLKEEGTQDAEESKIIATNEEDAVVCLRHVENLTILKLTITSEAWK